MPYPHAPELRHAQLRINFLSVKITISSENVADGLAAGVKKVFRKVLTLADWQRIVDTLDSIFLSYE